MVSNMGVHCLFRSRRPARMKDSYITGICKVLVKCEKEVMTTIRGCQRGSNFDNGFF